MLNRLEYSILLTSIDDLWNHKTEGPLRGWHGFGVSNAEGKPTLVVLVDPKFKDSSIIGEISQHTSLTVTPIWVAPFRQIRTGRMRPLSNPLQPGNLIFSERPNGTDSCKGTIGSLLRFEQSQATDPVWILSSHHILVPNETEATSGALKVHVTNDPKVTTIRFRPMDDDNNPVDAAVARKALDPTSLKQIFNGLDLNCTRPLDLKQAVEVQKLGNASNVTKGLFVFSCHKVEVRHCESAETSEFINQMFMTSLDRESDFAQEGDSGSLVAAQGRPVGLVFAITDEPPKGAKLPASARDPFILANPFQTVLDELKPFVSDEGRGRSLEMVPLQ